MKGCNWQEEPEIELKASKGLKQNFNVAQKNKMVLYDKVKEFEAIVESMEDCIAELKDCENKCTKECPRISC